MNVEETVNDEETVDDKEAPANTRSPSDKKKKMKKKKKKKEEEAKLANEEALDRAIAEVAAMKSAAADKKMVLPSTPHVPCIDATTKENMVKKMDEMALESNFPLLALAFVYSESQEDTPMEWAELCILAKKRARAVCLIMLLWSLWSLSMLYLNQLRQVIIHYVHYLQMTGGKISQTSPAVIVEGSASQGGAGGDMSASGTSTSMTAPVPVSEALR